MRNVDDKELILLCLKELREKTGYAADGKLSQRDLEQLCTLIGEETKIFISLSTLKRIFSGSFGKSPQLSTLNALTQFIGYAGWQDFRMKKAADVEIQAGNMPERQRAARHMKPVFYFFTAAGIVVVVAIIAITSGKNKPDPKSILFTARKVVSEGVPNSVVFSYNIDNIPGDSFFIQPTWNGMHRTKISKNHYTQTDIYYEPGYHKAKLVANDQVVKETVVHIPTRNWVGYSKVKFIDLYPEFIRSEYLIHDGVLGSTLSGIQASGIDTQKDKIYYYAYFPDTVHASTDNFTMTARMRTAQVKNTLCPWIVAEVYGENSIFYFMGTIPGCVSQIGLILSDQRFNGKTTDLSSFGCDVMQWQEMKISVRNKNVQISIGEKIVFEQQYSESAGVVRGLGFGSNGLCEVDYVALQDAEGKIIYENDFEERTP